MMRRFLILLLAAAGCRAGADDLRLARTSGARPRNIVFILCDDHRYDAVGFAGHPFLETPNMDRLAREGVAMKNTIVTTSLCSPSRASILTGLYAHNHGVVDNYNPVPDHLIFFPQYLQKAGYQTALVGKWHMGGAIDHRQRGFEYWVSFKGQGSYFPPGEREKRGIPFTPQQSDDGFNVNGRRVPQKGYMTDEITDYAVEFLTSRNDPRPFFLYIGHKAVHSKFVPADRHRGRYKDKPFPVPATFADTPENYAGKPMWVKNQRNSRHGADFGYNLDTFDLEGYYRSYCEALLAVDDSVGRILDTLKDQGILDSTLVVYMGDNGFLWGEQGLIDKRNAYEHSIRVPLLLRCPELFKSGTVVEEVVANIDIAPTLLDAAGLEPPGTMDGRSFLPLARGRRIPWPEVQLYEYYWEWNYPHTPTVHAVRGKRYKYIRYHGVWDTDELYDLQDDPHERRNLIRSPEHQETVKRMKDLLFDRLKRTGGMSMPLLPDRGMQFPLRHPDRSKPAEFPPYMFGRELRRK